MRSYVCTKCKCSLTEDNCTPSTFKKGCGTCKKCSNVLHKIYLSIPKNRDRERKRLEIYRKNNREKAQCCWYRYKYGITLLEYQKLNKKQDGKCFICKRKEKSFDYRTKKVRNLSVDHCHKTRKIRKLLCTNCNRDVGIFEKRQKEIEEYLKCHMFV